MTLHITNGDSSASSLLQTGIEGRFLPWRDVLHDGPVPAGLSDEELRKVRARFISDQGWGGYESVLAEFEKRDLVLENIDEHDPIILWFEHDLYDQLQLIQILDRLGRKKLASGRVSLICIDRFPGVERFTGLGQLTPDQLKTLWPERVPLEFPTFEHATRVWNAFCSHDPTQLSQWAFNDATHGLTFLSNTLLRHLEEFPSTHNGLSRTEQTIHENSTFERRHWTGLFEEVNESEESPYLGDTSFKGILDRLAGARCPLLRWTEEEVELTDIGSEVLFNYKDAIKLNGIDRWLGGVHLRDGGTIWRWDMEKQSLIGP